MSKSDKLTKNDSPHIVKHSAGISGKKVNDLEKNFVSQLPKEYYQFTEKQLNKYREYLEYTMTDGEVRFITMYEDPNSETYGNKIRSYATAYGHLGELKEINSPKYMKVRDNAGACWNRRRVQKYRDLVRFIKGHDLSQSIPLANSRLVDLIEQVEDKNLTLQAIREIHKILGNTSDGNVNIQINQNKQEQQFDFSRLTDEEMVEYVRLLNKLKTPADKSSDENNIEQEAEVIDNE